MSYILSMEQKQIIIKSKLSVHVRTCVSYLLLDMSMFFMTRSNKTISQFQPIASKSLYSPDLNVTLKKISDNLILTELQDGEILNPKEGTILTPVCSPLVDLSKPENLYGLAERIVAVESLIFLSKQYQFLQEYLEYLVPQTNRIMLQQFFAQVRHFYQLLLKYLLVCSNLYFGKKIFTNIFWDVESECVVPQQYKLIFFARQ